MTSIFMLLFGPTISLDPLPTDCSDHGPNRIIAIDQGPGPTWFMTNTTRWCNPVNSWIAPTEDPVFKDE